LIGEPTRSAILQDGFSKFSLGLIHLMKSTAFKSWINDGMKPFENAAGNLQEAMLEVKSICLGLTAFPPCPEIDLC